MWDIATQDKLFNEFISKGVIAEIKARSKLWDRIKKTTDKVDVPGKLAKQKLLMEASQSARAASNSSYPTPAESTPGETIVYLRRAMMFSLKFDGFALESAEKGGTPVGAIDFEKKGIFITISDDLSRQMMLDGSGHVCQANGAGSGTATLVVDSPYFAKATKFLKKNRIIDAYDGATQKIDSIKISSIDSDTQVTLASVQTWTEDSWILNEDTYAASDAGGIGEITGLDAIIRATDPPIAALQGLAVASYPEWKAHVFANGGVARPLAEDLIIEALDEGMDYGTITAMLYTLKLRRVWYKLLSNYKEFHNQKVMWGGWAALPFFYDGKEIPLVPDRFVPDGRIYGIDEDNLKIYLTKSTEVTWEKGDSGAILQKVAGKNEFVAEGHVFGNMGTGLRKSFFVIKDIDETV